MQLTPFHRLQDFNLISMTTLEFQLPTILPVRLFLSPTTSIFPALIWLSLLFHPNRILDLNLAILLPISTRDTPTSPLLQHSLDSEEEHGEQIEDHYAFVPTTGEPDPNKDGQDSTPEASLMNHSSAIVLYSHQLLPLPEPCSDNVNGGADLTAPAVSVPATGEAALRMDGPTSTVDFMLMNLHCHSWLTDSDGLNKRMNSIEV